MEKMKDFIEFINKATSPYSAIEELERRLTCAGFDRIDEGDVSAFCDGGRHYTVRDGSALIAFKGSGNGFIMSSQHSDSPVLKYKTDITGQYASADVEKYGSPILYSWLDRPLSVSGRVVLNTNDGIAVRNVDIGKDIAVIPSIALHLNREINDSLKLNPAKDMLPLTGLSGAKTVLGLIADLLCIKESDILSHDLYFYNREKARSVGIDDSLILSPRLDDLSSVYTSLCGFLESEDSDAVKVFTVFDNEETGSQSRVGISSDFLYNTLNKIAASPEKYYQMLENSIMVSVDNSHAVHPNRPELSDSTGRVTLGGGVVIKYNAAGRYATDAVSASIIAKIAASLSLNLQSFYSRADMPCGTTIGPISSARVSVPTVDIGVAQLAMHSSTETASAKDILDMQTLMRGIYSSSLKKTAEGYSVT